MVLGVIDQSIDRNGGRYFPSVRSIILVRFDPGQKDNLNPEDIQLESNPRPYLDFLIEKKKKILRGDTDEFHGIAREVITNSERSIADAVARIPVDGLSRWIDCQPTRSSRRVNSFRLPDELELTLSWKSIPFDSRLIRSMLVFHYEGTVTPSAFATGQPELDGASPVPTGYLVPATGENLRFVGIVDEISDSHGEEGDFVVLKARDLTALFIDKKLSPKIEKTLKPGETVLDAVKRIKQSNPEIDGFVRGPFVRLSPGRTLRPFTAKQAARLSVPPQERHKENDSNVSPNSKRNSSKVADESYWDAITDLCIAFGLVPTLELDALVLLEPRTLYKDTPSLLGQPGVPRFPRPGGHRLRIGDSFPVRRLVWGVNLKELRFFRKLGRFKAPAVRVTSFNPDARVASQRIVEATFPPNVIESAKSGQTSVSGQVGKKAQATNVSASGSHASIEVHNVILQGIIDPERLKRMAEQIYEAIATQELGIQMSTDDLASFSDNPFFDGNLDPDLLDLRAGDPIQLLVAPADRTSSSLFSLSELNLLVKRTQTLANASGISTPTYADAVSYLKAQGFRDDVARQFVKVLSTANLPSEFRVNTAQIDFDGGEEGAGGFSISIDARNYIRVRANAEDITQTRRNLTPSVVPGGEVVG